jgi:hypothetical protein
MRSDPAKDKVMPLKVLSKTADLIIRDEKLIDVHSRGIVLPDYQQ